MLHSVSKLFNKGCKITYQTTKGISAAIASSIPAAARGGLCPLSVRGYIDRDDFRENERDKDS